MRALLAVLGAVVMSASSFAAEWNIDASHTEIGFTVKHMAVANVNGKFNEFSGEVTFDPENVEAAKIKGVVEVMSIYTANENRDNHLRTSDFFDAENHPQIIFESSKISTNGDAFVAVGNLTMRGITKEIEIPFTVAGPINDPWGGTRVGIEGSTKINRMDWGVAWDTVMEGVGLVVSHDVILRLNVELIKK